MSTEDKLKQQIKDNDILIYMKGTPYEPRCGFSARTVQALIECEAQFSYVDVLDRPCPKFLIGQHFLRSFLKEI